jgi:hypothetical protein
MTLENASNASIMLKIRQLQGSFASLNPPPPMDSALDLLGTLSCPQTLYLIHSTEILEQCIDSEKKIKNQGFLETIYYFHIKQEIL